MDHHLSYSSIRQVVQRQLTHLFSAFNRLLLSWAEFGRWLYGCSKTSTQLSFLLAALGRGGRSKQLLLVRQLVLLKPSSTAATISVTQWPFLLRPLARISFSVAENNLEGRLANLLSFSYLCHAQCVEDFLMDLLTFHHHYTKYYAFPWGTASAYCSYNILLCGS